MSLDLRRIAARTRDVSLNAWPRIIPAEHARTPTGAGFGSSRFSSPSHAFRTLYAGDSFSVAFAEAVVRDRYVGLKRRYLYRPMLEALVVTEIATKSPLAILDFTGSAAYELGVNTDAKGARDHTAGQSFAEELYAVTTLDGILFNSRLEGRRCVAIFDRGFAKLMGTVPVDLVAVHSFAGEIARLGITVRRKRGF